MDKKVSIVLAFVLLVGILVCIFVPVDREEERYKGEIIYSVHVGGTWTNTLYLELYETGFLAVHDPNSCPWGIVNMGTFIEDHGENLIFSKFLSKKEFQEILAMMAQLPDEYYEECYILDADEATILYKGEQHHIVLFLEENRPHEQFIQRLFTIADQRYWLPMNEQ